MSTIGATDMDRTLGEFYRGRRVMITGGLGFIGSNLARRLVDLGADILLVDDSFVSPAEWVLARNDSDKTRYSLRNRKNGRYLTAEGFAQFSMDAAAITLSPATGCAEFPELTLDATGEVVRRQWDDGAVFGIVDTHSHIGVYSWL